MLQAFGAGLARVFQRYTPDPFVIAILLTAVTALLATSFTEAGPVAVLDAWAGADGVWRLLAFAMQMCLVLVTGHALAAAPPVARAIAWVASRPRDGRSAVAWVARLSILTSFLNWGLSLIVGALLARAAGRRMEAKGEAVHYPLLAAAGYTGLLTWHGGLSGTAPLKVTQAADLKELLGADIAQTIDPVSLYDTVFSPLNLVVFAGLLMGVPFLLGRLQPKDARLPASHFLGPEQGDELGVKRPSRSGAADGAARWEHSPWVMGLLLLFVGGAFLRFVTRQGIGRLDPNAMNLALLGLGLLAHGSPIRYAQAVQGAMAGCAGIVLQFPLYAGIMGMMRATGLAAKVAAVSLGSGASLYAVATFFSAGLLNFFVPSGGGQWAVQGPIAVQAANQLGVPLSTAVLAVAYGDQWSNMLQPFWALPLLGITGVQAKDLMGYTAAVMVAAGAWFVGCLMLLGH